MDEKAMLEMRRALEAMLSGKYKVIMKTVSGGEVCVDPSEKDKLAVSDNGLVYDIPYILRFIESDMYIFDPRGWRGKKVSVETLKEWYDRDFPATWLGGNRECFVAGNSGHFQYIIGNWKRLGGTWEQLRDVMLKVKDRHLRNLYRSFYRDFKWTIRMAFETALTSESLDDVVRWVEHVKESVDNVNVIADELGLNRIRCPKWVNWRPEQIVGWRCGKKIKELLKVKRSLEKELKLAEKLGERYRCREHPRTPIGVWIDSREDIIEALKEVDKHVDELKDRIHKVIKTKAEPKDDATKKAIVQLMVQFMLKKVQASNT